jgi:glycosyltransferase involved in cell wall biosynthesis
MRPAAAAVPAVHQLLPNFADGDAIGNEALALQKTFRSWGVRSEIFAGWVQEKLRGKARPVEDAAGLVGPADVLIYHFSIGHRLSDELPGLPGRKVLRYHNITPARFLEGVYPGAAERCRLGREQLPRLAGAVELGMAESAFNCAELREAGCAAVEEVPILLDETVLDTPPDQRLLARLGDGRPTVLHVGRLVPNKRIEDLIKTHYWLTRVVPLARLLVGGGEGNPYARGVRRLAHELRVPGVHFSGHVSNAALTAYYRSADVYLCLSEHEGYCVPLVEAMHFALPIVARAAAAVPGTLGSGGILLARQEPVFTAAVLARVLGDNALRAELGRRSQARLEAFRPPAVRERLRQALRTRLGLELG